MTRKILLFILCLMMAATLAGCGEDVWEDDYQQNNEDRDIGVYADTAGEQDDESDSGRAADSREILSVENFAARLEAEYSILLEDEDGVLSGAAGQMLMGEIDKGFKLFSSGFIRKMTDFYSEYDSQFILRIKQAPYNGDQGIAEWEDDITIILYYDSDPELNGVTVPVMVHEFGHAAHFIVEEYIGEAQSESDMKAFNGDFSYDKDHYDELWDEEIHGAVFAYDYGMSDYYEDIATVFEMLAEEPEKMHSRLIDTRNEPLFLKTSYIRGIMYQYISNECYAIFEPLYHAEEYWRQPAA